MTLGLPVYFVQEQLSFLFLGIPLGALRGYFRFWIQFSFSHGFLKNVIHLLKVKIFRGKILSINDGIRRMNEFRIKFSTVDKHGGEKIFLPPQ